MPNLNKVFIGGNLTCDPEMRVTPKGTAICSFSVANNKTWKDEGGQEHSEVCFIEVTAWGKTGEVISKYFTKGMPILIWGRLKFEQWEDKQTQQKRSKHKIEINFPEGGFDFVGGNKSEGGQSGEQQERQSSPERHAPPARQSNMPPPRKIAPALPAERIDEDVPF